MQEGEGAIDAPPVLHRQGDMDETAPPDPRTPDLTPLDPRYKRVLRIGGALNSAVLLVGATVGEIALDGWEGVFLVPALIVSALLIFGLPGRRYRSRGYRLGADELRVVKGVWFHSDITVPLGRVQHIDVGQGPIERANGLAKLVLHTAGTDNAAVSLEGLAHEDATAMRDEVREVMRVFMR